MAAVTELSRIAVNLKLNNGTNAQGITRYATLSLGKLDPNEWNAGKALAIKEALEPCLALEVDEVNVIKTEDLYDDGN